MNFYENDDSYIYERTCAKRADETKKFTADLDEGITAEFAPVGHGRDNKNIKLIRIVFSKDVFGDGAGINEFLSNYKVEYFTEDRLDEKIPICCGVTETDDGGIIALMPAGTEAEYTLREQLEMIAELEAADRIYGDLKAGSPMSECFKEAAGDAGSPDDFIRGLEAANARAQKIADRINALNTVTAEELGMWTKEYEDFTRLLTSAFGNRQGFREASSKAFTENDPVFALGQILKLRASWETWQAEKESLNRDQYRQVKAVADYITSLPDEVYVTYTDSESFNTYALDPENPAEDKAGMLTSLLSHAVVKSGVVILRITDEENDRIGGVRGDNGCLIVIPKDEIQRAFGGGNKPGKKPERYFRLPVII